MRGRPAITGKLGPIRAAASPDFLAGAARKVEAMVQALDPGDDLGCAVCGCGPHVPKCPVPALREAAELLAFMAAVPVASTAPARGVAS
jgi:hypothetical protein